MIKTYEHFLFLSELKGKLGKEVNLVCWSNEEKNCRRNLTVSEGMCMAVGSQVEHVIVDGSRM
jgi:hypothetical protein